MCGGTSITNATSSRPRAAAWRFSTTTTTAGWTFPDQRNPLDANWEPGKAPTSHLYKNNRDGTFTDVTEKSGLALTGWQTGVCVGDYDNDGWDDLFCCFWGHNILFHNNGDGTFSDVTRKAASMTRRFVGARAARFSTTTATGFSIYLSVITSSSIRRKRRRRRRRVCQWKGIPSDVRAARDARRHKRSVPQQWRRYVYRCFGESREF